ncbi:MAG: thiol-disulfide isomerase/thioredoxin [Flavobacteriales bacterium]|jgi:thiol-disulfide isomerase/thioredoxin
MKHLVYGLLALIFIACGEPTNNSTIFTVKAITDNATEVSISKISGGTVGEAIPLVLNNDVYSFEGIAEMPEYYSLLVDGKQHMLLLENGDNVIVNIESNSGLYTLEGNSEGSKLIFEVNTKMLAFYQQIDSIQQAYTQLVQAASTEERQNIISDFDAKAGVILDNSTNWIKSFIDKNIDSPVAVMALYQQISGLKFLKMETDMDYFEKVAASMQKNYPNAQFTAQIINDISTEKQFAIGSKVPDFSLPNPEGQNIDIKSFKGKVTLIDFWASWCGPCRKESPNLVKAYNRFNAKGFEILSISLDGTPRQKDPKASWIGAIEKDRLQNWTHVSDLEGWNTVVRPLFNFNSIPHTVLIDANGVIIAKNLRGAALERKLEQLFQS